MRAIVNGRVWSRAAGSPRLVY